MKTYDIKCPVCGTVNKDLYLEETDGWFECDRCHQSTKALDFVKVTKLPILTMEQLTVLANSAKAAATP